MAIIRNYQTIPSKEYEIFSGWGIEEFDDYEE
jgi:hypothetical protein